MTEGAIVRAATVGDLAAIQKVENSVFGDERWSSEMFVRLLFARNDRWVGMILVVEDAGEICGFAAGHAVRMGREAECELENLAVLEAKRGHGLGRKLLEHFLDWCGEMGAELVHLELRLSNVAAKKLYASVGFFETGIRRNYYRYPEEDAVLMSLHFGGLRERMEG